MLLAEPGVDRSRVAAVGYCFGGAMVLELATAVPTWWRSSASIPGWRPSAAGRGNIKGKVLVVARHRGPVHPVVGAARVRGRDGRGRGRLAHARLRGRPAQLHAPRADRAGLPGVAYDEVADRRSWRAMLDLFDEVFS